MHFASFEYVALLCFSYLLLRVSKPKYHTIILLGASLIFFSFDSLANLLFLFYIVLLSFYSIQSNMLRMGAVSPTRLLIQVILIAIPLMLYKTLIPHLPIHLIENQHRLEYLGAVPLGLSFYTLQAISIVIDTRNGLFTKTFSLKEHTLYLSFFPQLIAGPIERANNLMKQIIEYRPFQSKNIVLAVKFIVWGLFKKMVIADNLTKSVLCFGKLFCFTSKDTC